MSSMRANPVYRFLRDRREEIDTTSVIGRLSESDRARFYSAMSEHEVNVFAKGKVLISQLPYRSDHLYLIRDGRVKITQRVFFGQAIVDYKTPGEFVGETDMLLGQAPSFTATATEHVTAWKIPGRNFKIYIAQHPDFAAAVMQHLAARVNHLERFKNIHRGRVAERLAQRLLDLGLATSPTGGPGQGFSIQATQADLANSIGATLSAVEIEMAQLRRLGIIRTTRGAVHVDHPQHFVDLLCEAFVEIPAAYHRRFDEPNL